MARRVRLSLGLLVALALGAALPLAYARPDTETALFYRLRLEVTTTSDWTTLALKNPQNILALRVAEVGGQTAGITAQVGGLELHQTLERAEQGQTVGLIVDYALAAEGIDQPLDFRLQKGALNWSEVDVYAIGGDSRPLLGHVHHELTPGDNEFNPHEFSVDLSSLRDVAPEELLIKRADTPKLLWAFYYPWYGISEWASDQLADHPAQPYSSDDPAAIARQIAEAQSAGIDGFISSWWGPGDYTDQNLVSLLDLAQMSNFKVMIYFETFDGSGPRGEDEIYDWLAYFIRTYRDHPAYMKVDGKPVIVIWVSFIVPLETWKEVFARLRAGGLDAAYLAMGYDNLAALDVFDGLHEYGVFTLSDLPGTVAQTGRAVRYYPLLMETPSPKIWAATVQPGYDERLIPGRSGLVQDREDGAFYRRTFDAALASDPDWIFVSTWNEWWENTHIEPSAQYGDQYLELTREYAERWKGG
jgi:hypothetical protein